jgi:1-deoxy-D-xylulose-5-phosphate synthase
MTLLLDKLAFPTALKQLSISEMQSLAQEIRERLIAVGHTCGGHLASNLGVVELTLALHTVFESPTDKFLFDTSHQTYVHKMLTGRLADMFTMRQDGGLSGFAKIDESEHDAFGAGHASTALSAGLGMAHAREVLGQKHSVVSIIGDATLSGGMAFEALNNAHTLNSNFICVLNDNDMSISHPVGRMADTMTQLRTSPAYDKAKQRLEQFVSKIPHIGDSLFKRIEKTVDHMRDMLLDEKMGVIFEEFGFKYLGPIDGHDLPMLMTALRYAKGFDGPILIHVITKKGKGFPEAEADPVNFHGVSPKKIGPAATVKPKTFTSVFGEEVVSLAHDHADMVVITPAMTGGSGLNAYAEHFPTRFFDVGIAEEHAVTFAAGLARGGIKPILAIYSTFLQRGYDQMVHDVCLQNLPVIFALDRSGLVGEDGPTHHGVFDYAYMLPIPNLSILAPKDGSELRAMLRWSMTQTHPLSIRYSKEAIPAQDAQSCDPIQLGKSEILGVFGIQDRFDVVIIAVGNMSWLAYEAAEQVYNESAATVCVVNLRFVKPLDIALLGDLLAKSDAALVVEEGCQIGGVFSHIHSSFPSHQCQWHSLAIPDRFIDHGKLSTLRKSVDLTMDGIRNKLAQIVTQANKATIS